jgi:hypothetical protein
VTSARNDADQNARRRLPQAPKHDLRRLVKFGRGQTEPTHINLGHVM